ncbi:MAG: Electron transport complex protein RnfD [Firmicutes bacterium ADurb.Bin193]|nr:MAG: Electron transport complex protein RnfD [Firmicutes bacterium ADurb.Bin193]
MEKLLKVGPSPHIYTPDDTSILMQDVIIALMPALAAGVYIFGYRAAVITLISVLSAVIFEHLWNIALKKKSTIGDLSAVVSGILLAFNLPATVPFWIPLVGSFFMIIIVKMCFGGLGQNFLNPALGARAFLSASWPALMTSFAKPFAKLMPILSPDVVTSATPLGILKEKAGEALPTYMDLFIGNVGGCIGETSKIALLAGLVYLLVRHVITWHTPVTFVGTVALLSWIFGDKGYFSGDWLFHILSGGLFLGAFFMATDYSTTPITKNGRVVFGVGCGILTVIIRLAGGYPEGVSYSILLMNTAFPLIERVTAPRRFGKGGLKMRDYVRLGGILFLIAAVVALALALGNKFTQDRIKAREFEEAAKSQQKVFDGVGKIVVNSGATLEVKEGTSVTSLTMYELDTGITVYAAECSPKGYKSDIKMTVGIDENLKVTGVSITDASGETTGLGTRVTEPEFIGQFVGKTKDITINGTAPNENGIDAITGATVSSKAVTAGVNDALKAVEEAL